MLKSILKNKKQLSNTIFISSVMTLLFIQIPNSHATRVNSIFFVTKSDNRNQVHYGVQTNPNCSFKNSQPVYPYWKLANGKLERLLRIEVPIFGITNQSVSGNEVTININALRRLGISRSIMIRSTDSGTQQCNISAFTQINGKTDKLSKVHINWTRNGLFGLGGTLHSFTFFGTNNNQEKIACRGNCRF